ncbi:MAG: phosphoribosylglycinamide formyltransferase [Deltaproteobacteria bacterium]|nr:MAG: phosphoribosylglycinamide formyltransferase [Deltaproteobacteria bacterium]
MNVERLPIGILASGTGSNFVAISDAIEARRLDAEIRVLVCNRPGAPVIEKARTRGIRVELVDHRKFDSRAAFDRHVAALLREAGVRLVVLAGFDRLVTGELLSAFPERVINIHPALLPAFRGVDAQRQAAEHGVAITGATVHIVDEEVDHGPIIIQAAVPVVPGEGAEEVRRRILAQEHRIFPYAIQLFAEDRVRVEGRFVRISGRPTPGDEALVSPPIAWNEKS